jgi:hypothetical protein
MSPTDEKKIAAHVAKAMAMICVRNTMLGTLHAGPVPVTKMGDFSDVFVVDADGNHIPWMKVSRLDDDEMRNLMRQVVNRLYTFQIRCADREFQEVINRWLGVARNWEEPTLDPGLSGGRSQDVTE